MPFSKNPLTYSDVRPVLDAALAAGGGAYRLESYKHACIWRAKAYYLRKLLAEGKQIAPGIIPSTPYDGMKLQIKDNVVYIRFNEPTGELMSLDHRQYLPVNSISAAKDDDDPLLEEALEFAKTLGE